MRLLPLTCIAFAIAGCNLVLDVRVDHVIEASGGADSASGGSGGSGGTAGAGGVCGEPQATIACQDQPCNCLVLPDTAPVDHIRTPGNPPPFLGGPVAVGTFDLVDVTLYAGINGAGGAAPTGYTSRETSTWSGGIVSTLSETTDMNGTLRERFNATVNVKGHAATFYGSCCAAPVKPAEYSYVEATGDLTLGYGTTNGMLVFHYERR